MKWYIWALIAIALGLIIYFATKKKTTTSSTFSGQDLASAAGFNPYQVTKIS